MTKTTYLRLRDRRIQYSYVSRSTDHEARPAPFLTTPAQSYTILHSTNEAGGDLYRYLTRSYPMRLKLAAAGGGRPWYE